MAFDFGSTIQKDQCTYEDMELAWHWHRVYNVSAFDKVNPPIRPGDPMPPPPKDWNVKDPPNDPLIGPYVAKDGVTFHKQRDGGALQMHVHYVLHKVPEDR
jgi:hypothetical protein